MKSESIQNKLMGKLKAAFARYGERSHIDTEPLDRTAQIRKLRQTRTRMEAAKPVESPQERQV